MKKLSILLISVLLLSVISVSNPSINLPTIKSAEAQTTSPFRIVQTKDYNFKITTHEVTTASDYVYVTPSGNYSFSIARPWLLKYSNLSGSVVISFSTFGVRYNTPSRILRPDTSTVLATQTAYQVNTTLQSSGVTYGYLHVLYNFSKTPMKATATFKQAVDGSFNIIWVNAGHSYLKSTLEGSATLVNSSTLNNYGSFKLVYLTPSALSRYHILIDSSDYGIASIFFGKITYHDVDYNVVLEIYGLNIAKVDPSIVQNQACCAFTSDVTSGNVVLLFTGRKDGASSSVTSITDTRSTTYTSIVSIGPTAGTGTGSCDSTNYRYAQEWIGSLTSGGANTLTVSWSGAAGQMWMYELSGVSVTGYSSSSGENAAGGSTTGSVTSFTPASTTSVFASLITNLDPNNGFVVPGGFVRDDGGNRPDIAEHNTGLNWNGSATTISTTTSSSCWAMVAVALPIGRFQITLNYYGRDGTTAIQSLSPRCRLEAPNATITVVTGASGACIARVQSGHQIRVAMILAGSPANNSAFAKSSDTATCCFNRWNLSVTADTTYTVRTSVEINFVINFAANDGATAPISGRLNWIQIDFRHNSTRVNITTISGSSLTLPLYPTGNVSNTVHKITAFSASITTKNNIRPNATAINATANSQTVLIRVLVDRITLRFYFQNGNTAFSLTSITVQAPNGTITLSLGTGSSVNPYMQNGSITPDAFRIYSGNTKANSTAFTFGGTATTYSFRLLVAPNTVRFYFNNGNTAFVMSSITLQAPNATISASLGTATSVQVYMQNGTWTPDAFRIFGGNRKTNSTTFSPSGSAVQTFSFRLSVYDRQLQTNYKNDNSTNLGTRVWVQITFDNATAIRVQSNTTGNYRGYFGNGTQQVRIWWNGSDAGTSSIIVNETSTNGLVSYSFTSDGATEIQTQIVRITSVDNSWLIAGNRTFCISTSSSWVSAANELRIPNNGCVSSASVVYLLNIASGVFTTLPQNAQLGGVIMTSAHENWLGLNNSVFSIRSPTGGGYPSALTYSWSGASPGPAPAGVGGNGGVGPAPIVAPVQAPVEGNVSEPAPSTLTIEQAPQIDPVILLPLAAFIVSIATLVVLRTRKQTNGSRRNSNKSYGAQKGSRR